MSREHQNGERSSDSLPSHGPPSPSVWAGEYRVRRDEIDPDGRLTVPSLLKYLQDAAAHHASVLGASIEDLESRGQAWVMRTVRLAVTTLPAWGAVLRITTWPSGSDGLRVFRDYSVEDSEGTELARADSAWLIIDRQRRKPARLPQEWRASPVSSDRAFADRPRNPAREDPLEQLTELTVEPWDTDFNGHVNHVRYVEWLLTPRPSEPSDRRLVSLLVQFEKEAVSGDRIQLYRPKAARDPDQCADYFEVRRSDGALILSAEACREGCRSPGRDQS